MITLTCRHLDISNFKHSDVALVDIAQSLGQQTRWNGMLGCHYSIAQHSVLVSEQLAPIGPAAQMAGLLHDASEAYLSDINSEVKKLLPDYQALEEHVQGIIFERFLRRVPHESVWKLHDTRVAVAEYEDLHPAFLRGVQLPETVGRIPQTIRPQCPDKAIREFMRSFYQIAQLIPRFPYTFDNWSNATR
jgi:uncharacterized protein